MTLKQWFESYGDSDRFWDCIWGKRPFDEEWSYTSRSDVDPSMEFWKGFYLAEKANGRPITTYNSPMGDFELFFIGTEYEVLKNLKDLIRKEKIRRPPRKKVK